MRTTHTFAGLEVSAAAYDEIAAKLREACYEHAFAADPECAIDMHGIGITRGPEAPNARKLLQEFVDLCAFGDVDETSDALGWGELIANTKAFLSAAPSRWPKETDVGRIGDMAPAGQTHLRLVLDGDSDVCVEVWEGERQARATIEFCTTFGGGKSPRTREALVALMVAMEADNAACPQRQWPPKERGNA